MGVIFFTRTQVFLFEKILLSNNDNKFIYLHISVLLIDNLCLGHIYVPSFGQLVLPSRPPILDYMYVCVAVLHRPVQVAAAGPVPGEA